MFSNNDIRQMESMGMDPAKVTVQIENFKKGFPFIDLDRPAIVGDGILVFNEEEKSSFMDFFIRKANSIRVEKFVPASGAASRMFKHLFEFIEQYKNEAAHHEELQKDKGFNSIGYFLDNLQKFAFYQDLKNVIKSNNLDITELESHKEFGIIVDFLLSEKGLGYSNLPKALLKFHNYPEGARVAAEEHLVEAAHYAKDGHGNARIHFTLSPEHIEKFQKRFSEVMEKYERAYGVKFKVNHSIQKKSTDMIAVDEDNEPFRNSNGSILFRPGGHGALLENLNDIDADLVFVKNIDNIVPDGLRAPTYEYKMVIGGLLLTLAEKIHNFLAKAEKGILTEEEISSMWNYTKNTLQIDLSQKNQSLSPGEKLTILQHFLDRPMRICGMVKNEGEPGGGPFWVKDHLGRKSLQIVESSQIDFSDPAQKRIVESSTHFNPVDLVCITKNFKGEKFDLQKFVDPSTGFISLKSSGGKTLKAQELPGLWNGAMADWITLFVEVPIITFNPVKTVNDLLRKEHQA